MKKTKNWGYPRLCPCLILAMLITACKVKQPLPQVAAPVKNYELIVALNSGMTETEIFSALQGLAFGAPERKEAVFLNSVQQPEVLVYKLRTHDLTMIDNLTARLEKEGVRIVSLVAEISGVK